MLPLGMPDLTCGERSQTTRSWPWRFSALSIAASEAIPSVPSLVSGLFVAIWPQSPWLSTGRASVPRVRRAVLRKVPRKIVLQRHLNLELTRTGV